MTSNCPQLLQAPIVSLSIVAGGCVPAWRGRLSCPLPAAVVRVINVAAVVTITCLWGLGSTPAWAIENDECLACHAQPERSSAWRGFLDEPRPEIGKVVEPEAFARSIHGTLLCTACHVDVKEVPHPTPLQRVSCSQCHRIETEIYLQSDHGKAVAQGVSEAAFCQSCHGEPHHLLNSRDPASPVNRLNIPATCAACHEDRAKMQKYHLAQEAPVASYTASVHGRALLEKGIVAAAVCTDCHGSHDLHKATNTSSKLYWQHIPDTCGKCHENIRQTFLRSIHGQAVQAGKRDAPVCTDCHGEHSIDAIKQVTSKVYPSQIPETCGQCHAAERIVTKYRLPAHVVETYMDSFHGLSLQLGSATAANCASCHGAHDILPSSDERSSVHPHNLAKTCGKCHPGVSAQVAQGQIHSGTRPGLEHRAAALVRQVYALLICLVIGGMLLHNGLDFQRKLREHYRRMAAAGRPQRMSPADRVQHVVLLMAFVALAYTGFALKFPQAWWASPFVGRVDWRSLGHRTAAVIFCLLAAYHFWFITCTRRGRQELRALWPRRVDLVQPFQMLAYYLGRRKERPVVARYSYVEKAEYWALVWGSVVMAATGALMTWEWWTLRQFPKWLFDAVTAIHYYEAILACLAIVVWHLYWVMFDPDEYPMKWTWVTGRSSPSDQTHRRDEG